MQTGNETELRKIPLLDKAPDTSLERIARACVFRDFAPGQQIISYLDQDTDVYFVLAGFAKVRIYSPQGKIVGLRKISQGDLFGEFAAIDGAPRSASVEAEQHCRVAILPAEQFNKLMMSELEIAHAIIRHLVTQLRCLTARVFEFSTLAVNDRIEAELLRLSREHGRQIQNQPNKTYIENAPSQTELAAQISTHREAVSRHLSYLTRKGIVSRRGRTLWIEDMDRLTNMVRQAAGEQPSK